MNEHTVLLSLASNHEAATHLEEARSKLQTIINNPLFSSELWTLPVGSKHLAKYLNQLMRGTTLLSVEELQRWLKKTEELMGRTPEDRQQGIVRIDLDLLQFDDRRYHEKDWQRDYVKQLLDF